MQINQHNYEEFFLMYIDNELSVQEKEMVEAFVGQNPQLAGELELLKQTIAGADDTIEFKAKEKLVKKAEITEEELLTYLDNEADKELAYKIELEALNNDALKQELANLGKLYLKADPSIQYPAKEKLYRSGMVRRLDWRKLAIAASLLLCIGTWLVLNQSEQEELNNDKVAVNTPAINQPKEPVPVIADTLTNTDTPAAPQASFPKERQASREKQPKEPVKTVSYVHDRPSGTGVTTAGKNEMVTSLSEATQNGNSNKTNQPTPPIEPSGMPAEPVIQSSSTDQLQPTAVAKGPAKEKKSLFKKIGKQISDRALDILSDGGDNINVAGFAIRVEK